MLSSDEKSFDVNLHNVTQQHISDVMRYIVKILMKILCCF